jgi:hypothetical protein
MHHLRISDMRLAKKYHTFEPASLTLRLQLLQLSIEELEVRLAEVDFRQAVLA